MQKFTKENPAEETKETKEGKSKPETKASETESRKGHSSAKVKIPNDIFIEHHFISYSEEDLERITKNVTMKKPASTNDLYIKERYAEAAKYYDEAMDEMEKNIGRTNNYDILVENNFFEK